MSHEPAPNEAETPDRETSRPIPKIQVIAAMLWPSFLTAGAATVLFFTAFDPVYVFSEYDIGRMGAYSVGFLLFWALTASSCALSILFLRPCHTPCKAIRDQAAKDRERDQPPSD